MLAACSGSQARNDWQPGISPGGKQEGAAGAHKTSATVIEDDQREDLGGYPVRYPACGQGRIAPSPAALGVNVRFCRDGRVKEMPKAVR